MVMQSQIQKLNRVLKPQGQVFYGWYIVSAAGGIQLLSGMLWMQSYGAYVVLLQDEFGWSKTLVAGAFALTRIESGILGPLQGWMVDKYGPRVILRIGILMFGAGFMLFSQVESILTFYMAFLLIALGSSLGGFATVMVSLVNWFSQHRAKAVALSQLGFSMGGLSVPLIIICLEAYGWRTTAFFSGVIVILAGIPLSQVIKHRPSELGLEPDGISKPDDTVRNVKQFFNTAIDFTARQAMRTKAFWLISGGHACALLTVSAVMVHLVPHLTQGLGFTLTQAGLIVAMMTAFQMLGQLCGGYLGDRFNKRFICIACMAAHAIGLVMLAFATTPGMVFGFAALHGLAWGIRGPLMVALRADYFGPSSFGTIMGFSSLIVMLGMSTGPIFAGYMADVHGNYELGFSWLALGAFMGSFCFLAAAKPMHPEQRVQ
jgi:MFS family permease